MSVSCPSCQMASPEGAAYCDFCKEPFAKKARPAAPAAPAAPNPLAGLSKEKLLELPAEQLLKADAPPPPALPSWIRPVAYLFLVLCLATAGLSLYLLLQRYQDQQQKAPLPTGMTGSP